MGSGALRDTIVTAILGSLNNSDLKGDCHMFTVYIYTLSLWGGASAYSPFVGIFYTSSDSPKKGRLGQLLTLLPASESVFICLYELSL